jgi:hypothetical protein
MVRNTKCICFTPLIKDDNFQPPPVLPNRRGQDEHESSTARQKPLGKIQKGKGIKSTRRGFAGRGYLVFGETMRRDDGSVCCCNKVKKDTDEVTCP